MSTEGIHVLSCLHPMTRDDVNGVFLLDFFNEVLL